MKKNTIYLFLISSLFIAAKSNNQHSLVKPKYSQGINKSSTVAQDSLFYPKDLVLIYDGGSQRPDWNANQMRPYLYRMKDGKLQWQFDGFLFLEIMTKESGKTFSFVVNRNPANKEQWQTILNKTFTPGSGPGALDYLLDSLGKEGQVPPYKREVVLSIPNPTSGFQQWGDIDNQKMDFNNEADRIKAAVWYINQALAAWKKQDYKHLKLSGFYWVRESIANQSSVDVVNFISKYLHSIGMKFYWIPYNGAGHAKEWKQLGFDIAYQQPNYFFRLTTPYRTLTNAVHFAQQNKMALEMEFDGRLSEPSYRERFYAYLDEYEKSGVWEHTPLAYYEGGGEWLNMSESKDTAVRRAYSTLGNILVKRSNENIQFKASE